MRLIGPDWVCLFSVSCIDTKQHSDGFQIKKNKINGYYFFFGMYKREKRRQHVHETCVQTYFGMTILLKRILVNLYFAREVFN